MFLEIRESFSSLEDWLAWSNAMPLIHDPNYMRELAHSVAATGFVDPLLGVIFSQNVELDSDNFREGLVARGVSSRNRALTTLMLDYMLTNGWCSAVYLAEQATDFAEAVARQFPYTMESEYISNPIIRMRVPNIRHEDPLRLTFPDHSFDIYVSSDTLIYAASLENFLREARRVLRRTGVLLATFPFRYGDPDSEIFAEIVDGKTMSYTQPVFHFDHLAQSTTKRQFFVPGWNIIDIAKSVGFSSAEIVVQSSRIHAILGGEIATVFALKATA